MSINKIIEAALSDLVDGEIFPMFCPDEHKPEKYITYNPAVENPAYYADDHSSDWVAYMQVHYFENGNANVIRLKREISDRLEEADFSIEDIQTFYEKDTGYTHVCVSCNRDME